MSVAGSEMGGRASEDGACRSSLGDGHFSCSSLFSEFGLVAQHLEETYPGIALARSAPSQCRFALLLPFMDLPVLIDDAMCHATVCFSAILHLTQPIAGDGNACVSRYGMYQV
jgi:hypothetical protein